MASSVKRADTSETRPAPLVITTRLIITRMIKTKMPTAKLPAITKAPNASITLPAASGPSWPLPRIIRVDATFNPRRRTVAIRSKVGKLEKSSGRLVCNATIRTSSDTRMFVTKKVSRRNAGSGNTIIATSTRMPAGIVTLEIMLPTLPSPRRCNVISMTHSRCQKSDKIPYNGLIFALLLCLTF